VSAASIIALGYFVLFVDFTSQGRFWDKLAARVPALAKIIPPAAGSQATTVVKTMPEAEGYADRTLIVGEQASEESPAATMPAAVPVPAAAQAQAQDVKKMAAPRLTSSLTPFNINDNSRNRVISVPTTQAAADAAQTQAAPAAAAPAPEATAAPRAIAAKASYGAASRSEMMGQAAGPVYNLKGKSKKK
jgi:hypothetical protein